MFFPSPWAPFCPARAQIRSLARADAPAGTVVAPVGVNGIRTDGNVTLLVTGWNFGPGVSAGPLGSGTGPLLQFVRVRTLVQVRRRAPGADGRAALASQPWPPRSLPGDGACAAVPPTPARMSDRPR
jgi:hypothetical protein